MDVLSWYPSLKRYGPDRRQLSDGQWRLIEDLFPWRPPRSAGGRPPVPPRAVLEAALWLLRDGPVRIKCVTGTGGARQHVARTTREVDAAPVATRRCEWWR